MLLRMPGPAATSDRPKRLLILRDADQASLTALIGGCLVGRSANAAQRRRPYERWEMCSRAASASAYPLGLRGRLTETW